MPGCSRTPSGLGCSDAHAHSGESTWGISIRPILPQVPNGIAAYSIAPVASVGCAGVIGTNAFFEMPGEALSPLPNHATRPPAECARRRRLHPLLPSMPRGIHSPSLFRAEPPFRRRYPLPRRARESRRSQAPAPATIAGPSLASVRLLSRLVFSRAGDRARYHRDGRARRGASGALYPQSAPAGLNSLPRFGIADPARARRR
jgi:hypothetical protein